jgi:hypothetical protein
MWLFESRWFTYRLSDFLLIVTIFPIGMNALLCIDSITNTSSFSLSSLVAVMNFDIITASPEMITLLFTFEMDVRWVC